MNKRGIAIGQIFIYIVAAITFALIMIFGYKMITDFQKKGEGVEFFQFKNDLETDVKKIYTEYGAIRNLNLRTPTKYSQICFVNLDLDPKTVPVELQSLCEKDPYACDVWQEAWNNPQNQGYFAVDENVFLTPAAEGQPPIKVYKISLAGENQGYLCLPIRQGSFSFTLEGKGDHTEIS